MKPITPEFSQTAECQRLWRMLSLASVLAIADGDLFVECEEIVDVAHAHESAGEQPDKARADLAHVETMDAKDPQESLKDPSDVVIDIARLVAEVAFLIHGGDEEEIDEPTNATEPGGEEPNHSSNRATIVKTMGSSEPENPECVANGFGVCV